MTRYYGFCALDDVSNVIVDSAMNGIRAGCDELGIQPVKVSWYKSVSQLEWMQNGRIATFEQNDAMDGFFHRVHGVFLNRDLSPQDALETAIHEVYHAYQYKSGQFPIGRLTENAVASLDRDAENFVRRIMAPSPAARYTVPPHLLRYCLDHGIRLSCM